MPDFVKKEGETGDFRSDDQFLLGYFEEKEGALYYRYRDERVIVEPWGENSLRVRIEDAGNAAGVMGIGRETGGYAGEGDD